MALQKNPQEAFAFKYAGKSLLALGQIDQAQNALSQAHQLDNRDPETVKDIGNCLNAKQNQDEAIRAYQYALSIDPDYPPALNNIGLIMKQRGRTQEARSLISKALSLDPTFAAYHLNLGTVYMEEGELDEALSLTEAALSVNPEYADAYMNLGSILSMKKSLDKAIKAAEKAVQINPSLTDAYVNLSGYLRDAQRLDEALDKVSTAIRLNPLHQGAHINMGQIYKDKGDLDQALAATLKAIELKPDHADAHVNLGGILKEQGQLDQALAATLKAIELKPDNSKALYGLATINLARGEIENAKTQLNQAINMNAQEVGAYFELSITIENTADAENLIRAAERADKERLAPKEKALLCFAFANCLHKLKLYDKAAEQLQSANTNKLIAMPSNAEALVEAISACNSREFPVEHVEDTCGQGRIFIVGMPRSGSTLLETILSSGTSIKDLGETRALARAIEEKARQSARDSKTESVDNLYTRHLDDLGEDTSDCIYSIDKQLYNFMHTGIIARHMPSAKIIHCQRNPMDNILSMYRSNLTAGNNFTSDLKDAANVLIVQENTMQGHKEKYPNQIFTFNYDTFVNSPKTQLLPLLEWLELDWDEDYLHPEKIKRIINTASVMQARRPISNKSVGGWRNYRSLLKPAEEIIRTSGILEV